MYSQIQVGLIEKKNPFLLYCVISVLNCLILTCSDSIFKNKNLKKIQIHKTGCPQDEK